MPVLTEARVSAQEKLSSQRAPAGGRLVPRYLERKRTAWLSAWFHDLLGSKDRHLLEGRPLYCLQFKANSLGLLPADPSAFLHAGNARANQDAEMFAG